MSTKKKMLTKGKVAWLSKCARCNKMDTSGILYGEGLRHFYCSNCIQENKERIEELEHYRQERKANAKKGAPIEIKIETYVPCKWRFLDLETNEVYMPTHTGGLIRDLGFKLTDPEVKLAKKKKKKAKKKVSKQ